MNKKKLLAAQKKVNEVMVAHPDFNNIISFDLPTLKKNMDDADFEKLLKMFNEKMGPVVEGLQKNCNKLLKRHEAGGSDSD